MPLRSNQQSLFVQMKLSEQTDLEWGFVDVRFFIASIRHWWDIESQRVGVFVRFLFQRNTDTWIKILNLSERNSQPLSHGSWITVVRFNNFSWEKWMQNYSIWMLQVDSAVYWKDLQVGENRTESRMLCWLIRERKALWMHGFGLG